MKTICAHTTTSWMDIHVVKVETTDVPPPPPPHPAPGATPDHAYLKPVPSPAANPTIPSISPSP
ncbi:hypothetical protein LY76DRAFT_651588 [Colletotrichum caudatum]|nr:hypothetical protein LY76DRAFT_651588 [Colletotrichum caudatum]